jgi:hypothetical protein
MTTVVDLMDLRPGGTLRFVSHDPDGVEYAFRGVYRESHALGLRYRKVSQLGRGLSSASGSPCSDTACGAHCLGGP